MPMKNCPIEAFLQGEEGAREGGDVHMVMVAAVRLTMEEGVIEVMEIEVDVLPMLLLLLLLEDRDEERIC
jgi:hypothetical protein